jgi:HEAT repeat protein
VPYLAQGLAEEGDEFRLRVANVLGHLGPLAAPALPALIPLLANANADLRKRAAFVIGQIGSEAEEMAPLVTTLLADADPAVRVASAQALWRIGSWSEAAFNILLNAVVEDRTPWSARAPAIQALGGLGPAATAVLPSLRRLLAQSATPKNELPTVALALWQIAGETSALEACFAQALAGEDSKYLVQVLRMLPVLGAAASPFRARVDQLATSPDPTVRVTAEAVVKRIGA